jgi:hypothetical protein
LKSCLLPNAMPSTVLLAARQRSGIL